jgi:uncharacterized membrane protein HdeD (DUF308 family)
MRKAAGIMLIIAGLISLIFFYSTLMAWIAPTTVSEVQSLFGRILLLDAFLSLGLIMGGGICALRKKYWWWVLSGAIFSIFVGIFIFTDPALRQFWSPLEILMGTVAVVFICLRRRDWSESQA